MGQRRVAKLLAFLTLMGSGLTSLASPLGAAQPVTASSRMATYTTPSGDAYFALAVQPAADPALLQQLRSQPASVVVVVDTSASQQGAYRSASLAAAQALLEQLREGDSVKIVALDVRATPLSEGFATADAQATQQAVDKLNRRLPLGNTNLAAGLDAARADLLGRSSAARSIVYIGDGASLGSIRGMQQFQALVDALRDDQIAVHSVAIGPSTDVALLATLANQTGGVTLLAGENQLGETAQLGRQIADAAVMAPVWATAADVPQGMQVVQSNRLPPLRLDRDSVLLGRLQGDATAGGPIRLTTMAAGAPVEIQFSATAEASHPDFAFLPGMVSRAETDGGLTLPTAGSAALREASLVLAAQADKIAEAGAMALQQGNLRGAAAVAQLALEADPNHPEAQRVAKLASDPETLTQLLQQPAEGGAAAVPPPPPLPALGADPLLEAPSGLLGRVEAERAERAGRLRAEVRAQLRAARNQMATDPVGVTGSLKSLLAVIQTEPDIDPAIRSELIAQVRSAIQTASRREAEFMEEQIAAQQQQAAAAATASLLQQSFREEARIEQLSMQLNALLAEGLYETAAAEVAPEIIAVAAPRPIAAHVSDYTELAAAITRHERIRALRERNFVEALAEAEKAFIPFVGDPPIVYPDAEVWQRLSRRRLERYGSIELTGDNATERRIYAALDDETTQTFVDETLGNAVRILSEAHDIPIWIDLRALEELGLTSDTAVTIDLKNVTLRSFLRLMLDEVDLVYMIQDEVLKITTPEAAEENLVIKVYPVGDLAVPIISGGMMGGMMGGGMMGGGMGGGMMGGMGGGMGGMGGGMGGMGGGMGGMGMGGGMGGMFAVPDDVSLADKPQQSASAAGPTQPVADAQATAQPVARAVAEAIDVTAAPGQSRSDAWHAYFRTLSITTPAAQAAHDARVAATVRKLNTKARAAADQGDDATARAQFADVRDVIAAALASGHVQPWMYQAYALALLATDGPRDEVERALLSAADFAETHDDLLNVARHLEHIGSKAAALQMCRDASLAQPMAREPFLIGLRLARELDDLDGLKWACAGMLGQVWPEEFAEQEAEVRLVARATYQQLVEAGRTAEAEQFAADMNNAASHDAIVRVTWTGDADIDVMVEEPSGTRCSLQNTHSPGGGVLLGDAFPGRQQDATSGTVSETYICPKGFTGKYRLLVERVWGNVSTGHVTVEVLTDIGRPEQRYVRQQVPLTEKDALVVFAVQQGRRTEPLGAAQLENLQQEKEKMGGAVLAQIAAPGNSSTLADYYGDMRGLAAAAALAGQGGGGFFRAPAVGFQPEITTLPEGAMMFPTAVISADRRYVRITPNVSFTQIGDVNTFNFVEGTSGTSPGGGGGTGGVGGGLGGGGLGGGGVL